jgi:hypothetical protein
MRLLRQAPAIAGVFRNLDRDRETSVILLRGDAGVFLTGGI